MNTEEFLHGLPFAEPNQEGLILISREVLSTAITRTQSGFGGEPIYWCNCCSTERVDKQGGVCSSCKGMIKPTTQIERGMGEKRPYCKEYLKSLPLTSEHCWNANVHGLPFGNCIHCGKSIDEWNKQVGIELSLQKLSELNDHKENLQTQRDEIEELRSQKENMRRALEDSNKALRILVDSSNLSAGFIQENICGVIDRNTKALNSLQPSHFKQ